MIILTQTERESNTKGTKILRKGGSGSDKGRNQRIRNIPNKNDKRRKERIRNNYFSINSNQYFSKCITTVVRAATIIGTKTLFFKNSNLSSLI